MACAPKSRQAAYVCIQPGKGAHQQQKRDLLPSPSYYKYFAGPQREVRVYMCTLASSLAHNGIDICI